jgi:aminoglycoside phosphotransferase (APT) family kinase protein
MSGPAGPHLVDADSASAAVEDLVRRELGWKPDFVDRIDSGDNWVWEAGRRGHAVIVKSGLDPQLEAWGYQRAREASVRVPEVLAVGKSPSFPYAYEILSSLEGVPLPLVELSASKRTAVLRGLGSQIARLHGVATQGFGPPDQSRFRETGEMRGVASTWDSAIISWMGRLVESLQTNGVLEVEVGRRLQDTVEGHRATLGSWSESRLLHGDLRPGHVFVDRRGRVGLIDFEGVLFGDPAYDIAVMTFREPDYLEPILDGYGPRAVLGRHLEARLEIYRLLRAMLELRWGVTGSVGAGLMRMRAAKLVEAHLALEGLSSAS